MFGFALDAGELAAVDALDAGVRGGPSQDELDIRTAGRVIPGA